MTSKFAGWVIATGLVIVLIFIGLLYYQNAVLKSQLAEYAGEKNIEYKALTESSQRAETKIAKIQEELDIFTVEVGIDLDNVREDFKSLGGKVVAVAASSAKTNTVVHNHYPSDGTTQSEVEVPVCKSDGRPIDVHGYTKRVETRRLEDSNGMRIADVSFSAARERPWSSKVYGLRYKILNTIGRGPRGQVILVTELIAESPEAQPGETFRIEGVESRVLQAPAAPPEFEWWDPTIYLAAQLGIIAHPDVNLGAAMTLGFSVMSYGDWRFIGISIGYDAYQNTFFASFVPFLYNIGSPLPLLSDLWIGPYVGLDHEVNISVGLMVGTRL